MNNFSIYHLFSAVLLVSLLAFSCNPDEYDWEDVDTSGITARNNVMTGPASVFGTGLCSYTYAMEIRANSTYTWSVSGLGATITSLSPDRGDYKVEITFDDVTDTTAVVVTAVENSADVGQSFDNTMDVQVLQVSTPDPNPIIASYEVTTTYGYHDFLPDYAETTIVQALTAGSGTDMYKVNDFSGGLYSVGPYDTYGTDTWALSNDFEFTIDPTTNAVTWSGQGDPWGDILPTAGGVNAYDPATETMTISWTCTAYGENGVSNYTKIAFSCIP